ncbi:hypothetical protein QEV11_08090 [Trueperella pyogenes]|uniref:hypothetical protein n=1 Tax=Trueperella pyogenes TaxID=1661 RepID=UPI003244FF27
MCSRRARAGANVLLVFLAGLAEVDVHIEQAWQHDLAGQVDALGVETHLRVDDAGTFKNLRR